MPQQSIQQITSILANGGRSVLNALYPNEFEYYAVTFELVDSQDKTIDYLTFPISPSAIDYNLMTVANVRKNFNGVTALDSEKFVPAKYMISGSFGRNLKILLDRNLLHPDSTQQGKFTKEQDELILRSSIFNAKIKTGYGTIKLLEAIVDKSSDLDQYNKPCRLYFYNPALGHSFLVKINSFNAMQDYQTSNMIWKYNIAMTTVAPLDKIVSDKKESLSKLTIPFLQRNGNKLSSTIQSIIPF